MPTVANFKTQDGVSKYAWLFTSQERIRYNLMVERFAKENPAARQEDEFCAQMIFEIRIMLQRLMDNRVFFHGENTDGVKSKDGKQIKLDREDSERKHREWSAHYITLQKELREWVKVAKNISSNEVTSLDLSSLFSALDAAPRSAPVNRNGKAPEAAIHE